MRKWAFDKKIKVKKLRKTTGWPDKKCYKVEITENGQTRTFNFFDRAEFHLAEKVKEMLTQKQIDTLLPFLEEFESEAYNNGLTAGLD